MSKLASSPSTGRLQVKKFQVGDLVDVLCDHNRQDQRVRDWLQGVVVQADEKMIAVQFLTDVYLTDGWMVPDRVLWCRQGSESVRPTTRRRMGRASPRRN